MIIQRVHEKPKKTKEGEEKKNLKCCEKLGKTGWL